MAVNNLKLTKFLNKHCKNTIRYRKSSNPSETKLLHEPDEKSIHGFDIIKNALLRNNVRHAFVYNGGPVVPIIDSLYQSAITLTINSHEQNCGYAATGYAKTSNNTGLAIVTSGPGITNIITAMLDATNDSTPLVVISGNVPLSVIGTNAFQEAPAVDICRHVTKYSFQIQTIDEIDEAINKAFTIANEGKKGAVHIDIPKCVTVGKVWRDVYNSKHRKRHENFQVKSDQEVTTKDSSFIQSVTKMINFCERPIIYLGQGCLGAYQLLRDFAIESNIPVTSTIHGCGIFDESHKLSLQWCGIHGRPAANYALQEADCIIALGSRFDDRTTGNVAKYAPAAFGAYKSKKSGGIVHVNIEKSEIQRVVKSHYDFHMDCKDFLTEALRWNKFNPRKNWIARINQLKMDYDFVYNSDDKKIYMENVLRAFYKKTKHLGDKIIFTTGVGNHQMQAYQYIRSHYPQKIISSGALGAMGTGLPYAIGAKIANPEKIVICLDGDGSFNMTLTDLKTVAENNIPVKIAIMNNDSLAMVMMWQKLFYDHRHAGAVTKNPSYTKLAESYGIKALSCDDVKKLPETIDQFLNYEGPILCDFKIEKTMLLPLVLPGRALDDIVLKEPDNIFATGLLSPAPGVL